MAALTELQRMEHVAALHNLQTRACPAHCDPDQPDPRCKSCVGWGVVFTMDTKPCGPGCPVGNPQ